MKTLEKSNQTFFAILIACIFTISITSCGNAELDALQKLVPDTITDKKAYLEQAVKSYNAVQAAIADTNMIGRNISPALSDVIMAGNPEGEKSTQAVKFSVSKIYESFNKIPLDDLPNANLVIYFGRYPVYKIGQQIDQEILNAGITQENYNQNYAGRQTVVLKYEISGDDKSATQKSGGTEVIDNLGRLCPIDCPKNLLTDE